MDIKFLGNWTEIVNDDGTEYRIDFNAIDDQGGCHAGVLTAFRPAGEAEISAGDSQILFCDGPLLYADDLMALAPDLPE